MRYPGERLWYISPIGVVYEARETDLGPFKTPREAKQICEIVHVLREFPKGWNTKIIEQYLDEEVL